MNNTEIANAIRDLIVQIQKIDGEIKIGIVNFKQAYKNCDFASEWQGQGLAYPQYLRLVCEKGYNYFKDYILNPLLISLLDFHDHLTGIKAYTASYKTKMKGLVASIHRYVVVTSFFGKNINYIVTDASYQNEFKKIILTTNQRLMGCDKDTKFPIQTIATKIGMDGDHAKILAYMNTQCIILRKELL